MSAEAQAVGAGAVGAGAVGATDAASSVGAVPTVAAGAGSPVLGDHRVTLDSSERTEKKLPLERCVLEQFTRCSESHLWKLMMSFYDRKGIDSWSQGVVPHFITCNSFIGRAYARVLQGFLRDCASKGKCLDPTQPLYVIELGVGSGKFSYYMLKALLEMAATLDFPVGKIVYVMTDFTDANVGFWRNHPQLRAFFESGQMECAIFDAVRDTSITLSVSGVVLEAGSVVNPLCIVANYLFDTLCHDIFQVTPPIAEGGPGILKEGLISVGSKRAEEPDALDPEIIKRLDNRFKYAPIDDDYYSEKEDGNDALHFRRILAWYRDYFGTSSGVDKSGASILMPIGALRALRRLTAFASGQCLVVSGDKGNNNPEQFRGLMDPHIAVHGSFSVMVNYHAIGTYVEHPPNSTPHTPQRSCTILLRASAAAVPPHPNVCRRPIHIFPASHAAFSIQVFYLPRRVRVAQPPGGGITQGFRVCTSGNSPRRRRGQRRGRGG